MKLTLFILSLVLIIGGTNEGFAQVASSLSNEVQPFHISDHPATAVYTPLQSGGSFTVGTGEQPLWQFVQPAQEPLGDVARRYREEWKNAPKSKVRLEKVCISKTY